MVDYNCSEAAFIPVLAVSGGVYPNHSLIDRERLVVALDRLLVAA